MPTRVCVSHGNQDVTPQYSHTHAQVADVQSQKRKTVVYEADETARSLYASRKRRSAHRTESQPTGYIYHTEQQTQ